MTNLQSLWVVLDFSPFQNSPLTIHSQMVCSVWCMMVLIVECFPTNVWHPVCYSRMHLSWWKWWWWCGPKRILAAIWRIRLSGVVVEAWLQVCSSRFTLWSHLSHFWFNLQCAGYSLDSLVRSPCVKWVV